MESNSTVQDPDPSAAVYNEDGGELTPAQRAAARQSGAKAAAAAGGQPDSEPEPEGKKPRPYVVLEQDPDDEDLFRRVKNAEDPENGYFMVVKADQAKDRAATQLDVDRVTLVAPPARSFQPELLVREVTPRFKRTS